MKAYDGTQARPGGFMEAGPFLCRTNSPARQKVDVRRRAAYSC